MATMMACAWRFRYSLEAMTLKTSRCIDDVADSRGLGLELTVVRHGAGRHGGRLESRSTPHQGSTFSVFFPYWDGRTSDGQAESTDRG